MAGHSLITEPLKTELLRFTNENCNLDVRTLVDRFRASVCHRFFPGEKISLKLIKRNGNSVEGVVIGRSSCSLKVKDETPSKRTNKGHGSPFKPNGALATYDIKVDDQEELISSVPGGDIERCVHLPSEEELLQFVLKKKEEVVLNQTSAAKQSSTSKALKPGSSSSTMPVRNGTCLPHKRKLNLDCVVSLPKLFCSASPSKMKKLQLKLVKVDAPVTSNGKKMKQMTLFEMASKMTSPDAVKKNGPSRAATNGTVVRRTSVVNSFSEPKPIPEPKPFTVPSGFPSEAIGDSLLVIQFVICHREFLRPEKSLTLSLGHLMAALMAGPDGFFYLNHLLVSFLRVFFQDSSKKYEVFKMKLSALPLSIYSASELTRLCLEKCSDANTKMVSDIIVRLEAEEFYGLSVVEKVNVFVVLCNEVLDTPGLARYMEKIKALYTDLILQKVAASKENVIDVANDEASSDEPMSANGFYGLDKFAVNESKEESDCILVVRNERLEALKAAKAKKLKMKKEQELMMQTKQRENINKKFKDVRRTLDQLYRISPLGSDRNQSLYWLMIEAGCGLVVERFPQVPHVSDFDRPTTEWFIYDTEDKVNSLVRSLSDQLRNEHLLSKKLKLHLKVIKEAFQQHTTVLEAKIKVLNGAIELEDVIYEEMLKVEKDVFRPLMEFSLFRNDWLDKMEKAKTCSDFVGHLLELCSYVPENALDESVGDSFEKWKVEVQECHVLSKLYVLLHVFLSFIKWNQLPKHVTCGVCNKRNQRALVVICKQCTTAFHVNCLNPPLLELPEGGHFNCPKCEVVPDDDEDDKEDEEEVDNDSNSDSDYDISYSRKSRNNPVCCNSVSKSKGDTVTCSCCEKAYHKGCHKPPLRNTPRGGWVCSKCANKKTRKGSQRH